MSIIAKLRAKIKDAQAKANAILDAADSDNDGVMTEEQTTQFDNLTAEINSLKAQLEKRVAFESENQDLETGTGRQTAPVTVRDNRLDDPNSGFTDLAEFSLAVRGACLPGGMRDNRLNVLGAPSSPHKEGGSSDGYMVPTAMRNSIYDLVFANELDLLNMVDSEPTSGNSVQMLRDETTPWGSTGIRANWAAEGSQLTESNLETEGSELKLHKLYAFVTATEELLEDAPRLNNRLTRGAARAINWKANEAIIYGTGAGQPLGFFNSSALVTVAKESGQAADTIVAANLSKMYSRNLNPGRGVWIANSDTLPQLVGLTIGDQPVYTLPQSGLTSAPNGTLFGRPLLFTEQCKTLGDAGDIMFIDPMGYYLARKMSVNSASSIHLYFDYDVQAFRWTFRIGGQPYLSAAVSPKNGSSTKSHFVTVAARA